MDTTIVSAADVPAATISDRVRRGELARIATGVYTSDVRSDPAGVVAREWHNIAGRVFPDAVIVDRSAVTGGWLMVCSTLHILAAPGVWICLG